MSFLSKTIPFSVPQQPGQRLQLGNLQAESLALLLSEVAQQQSGVILVVTPDSFTANHLEASLNFFAPELPVLSFPDWETLPYDQFSPHQDIISQRLFTLTRLPYLQQGILLVSVTTLMQRIAPLHYIQSIGLSLKCGEKRSLETLRQNLQKSGYHLVSQVITRGEFAVRGAILDIFPMGSDVPYRIDFLDEEVDSIRQFDPDSQRSTSTQNQIELLPAREFPLSEKAIEHFRQQWRENFVGNPLHCPLYESVSQGRAPAGIEYYLPLFFSETQTLLDYLPREALLIEINTIHPTAEQFWQEIQERYEQLRHNTERPILAPAKLYKRLDELFAMFKRFPRLVLHQAPFSGAASTFDFPIESLPSIAANPKSEAPFSALQKFLYQTPAYQHILFCVESAGRREVLTDLLKPIGVMPERCASWSAFLHCAAPTQQIVVAPLEKGFVVKDASFVLITEAELFDRPVAQRQRKSKTLDAQAMIHHLAELSPGSPVVHIDHGIGRYRGLQPIQVDGQENEFLVLEYADHAKLYVPVSSLDLISRYSGGESAQAPWHRLGSDQWEKAKRKAAEQMQDVAAELLDIYARREAQKGYRFSQPDEEYAAFAAQFPFTETPDQQQAIEQVIQDMIAEKPMDRLICGDVGFGKTEVAMRAAFLAIQSNKQVIVLVPTTLLAQQHGQNFKDRFAEWPVHIEVLSRFRSPTEQKKNQQGLQEGKIDLVIGTHKLLNKELSFPRLGLVIIDEEHRFGVQQKERLKALRSEVDVLSLTATPIPRTLNLAFSGLRELSIIATPPARRLSIKTFVQVYHVAIIREAILRELLRGGQVYFLHNQVKTIEKTACELAERVPEARIRIAHGQLRERELEQIMADFYHKRFNVLVCTTIIETGIDIPSANTIIIDRADQLGLAQLHQLRGRVGRSHHQAYAYLMTPPQEVMTSDALKRLDALSRLEDLGAGFALATHDLEIRGAGALLGEEQSGNMQGIGFSLYMELLEQTVHVLKAGQLTPTIDLAAQRGVEIDLHFAALIPESYLPDVHSRLVLYKRIASATEETELTALQVEMIDRFGLLPEATQHLFAIAVLKLQAKTMGIKKITVNQHSGLIEFKEKPVINLNALLQCIHQNPKDYKLEGTSRLRFFAKMETAQQRIETVKILLQRFAI